jgi:exodeoxyribonuclease-3
VRALPGEPTDDQARYIEATIGDLRVASLYLPNGNPLGTDKFTYKLAWMRRLKAHAETLLAREIPFVLAGDYNVAPTDDDVYDPSAMIDDAICQPESRARFRALINLGLTDAFRVLHAEPHRYSFWDYQAGRWYRDEGLRIDHLLLSPQAADRLVAADIDKTPRGKDKASDHTPVWCEIAA